MNPIYRLRPLSFFQVWLWSLFYFSIDINRLSWLLILFFDFALIHLNHFQFRFLYLFSLLILTLNVPTILRFISGFFMFHSFQNWSFEWWKPIRNLSMYILLILDLLVNFSNPLNFPCSNIISMSKFPFAFRTTLESICFLLTIPLIDTSLTKYMITRQKNWSWVNIKTHWASNILTHLFKSFKWNLDSLGFN